MDLDTKHEQISWLSMLVINESNTRGHLQGDYCDKNVAGAFIDIYNATSKQLHINAPYILYAYVVQLKKYNIPETSKSNLFPIPPYKGLWQQLF